MSQQDIKKIVAQEYIKCSQDPAYFMKKYCYIQHPNRGRILFHLYPFQEKVLHLYRDNQNTITLKSRQLGISTLVAAYSLWLMIFHKDKNILALATTQLTARNLFSKTQFMYSNLPKWLKLKSVEDNKLSLRLINGSRMRAASSSSDAARSEAVSLLIIDEAAFIENIEETFASAQQTLATGGQCIALSCVTKDTYVVTDKGIKQIKYFIQEENKLGFNTVSDYNVLGFNKLRPGNLFYNNGNVPTKIITTRYSDLEGSENHKLFAFREGIGYSWTRLDELKLGDHIAIQKGLNVWGNNDKLEFEESTNVKKPLPFNTQDIIEDFSYFCGLYLSEGSSDGKYAIDITCGDFDDIKKSYEKLGLNYTESEGRLAKRFAYKSLVDLMKYIGFDFARKSYNKFIPDRFFEVSKPNIVALLQGLFDGDGTVTSKGIVSYSSTSKLLIEQIRILLLNLGICSTLSFRSAKYYNDYVEKNKHKDWAVKWNKHNHDNYTLEIYGKDLVEFNKQVGFRIRRKQDKLDTSCEYILNCSRSSTKNIIPGGVELIKLLHSRSGLSKNNFIRESGKQLSNILNDTTLRANSNVSRSVLQHIFNKWSLLLNQEELAFWKDILSENIRWVPITNIQDSTNETFDFSLPDNSEDFWAHSVTYNGIIGHQTPNGVGNWFHKTWTKAESRDNTFIPILLPWTVHPERDQKWRDQQDADLGVRHAAQECDCSFLTSGATVFEAEEMAFYETTSIIDPIEKRGVEGNLWIWESPDYMKNYLISADVARGDSSDYSTFQIFDVEEAKQVAEYRGKLSPKDFGNMLVGVASEYNDALLVIENANIGWATIEQVLTREYRNLYYSSKSDMETVESYMAKYENDRLVPGFTQSSKTRPLVIAKMMEYVRDKSVTIFSKRLLQEMRVFLWKNGKPQAQVGYNDDLIMAFAIGLYVRDTALKLRQQGMDLTRAQLSSISNLNKKAPVVYTPFSNGHNPYRIDTPHGQEDISWLLK